jgi:hypothetical protein
MASEPDIAQLLEAGALERARLLCTDLGYLEAKCIEAGIAAVEKDLRQVAASVQGPDGHILRELHRVVQDEAPWLAKAPGALAVTVFNRLFCAGWPRQKIEEALTFPKGLPPLHLRRPPFTHSRGTPLRRIPLEAEVMVAMNGRRGVSSSVLELEVWEVETSLPVVILRGLRGHVSDCAMSADGRRIAASSANGYVRVWDALTGNALAMLGRHDGPVWGCAITADGHRVVSACNDSSVTVWEVETAQSLYTLSNCFPIPAVGCAVTDDGRWAVSAHRSDRGLAMVWEMATGQLVTVLEGLQNTLTCCALTADGQRVVAGAEDGTLAVWEVETGKILATCEGHRGAVRRCAITADGQWMVSASTDCTLKLWELSSGRCLHQIHGGAPFLSVAAAQGVICARDGVGRTWILSASSAPVTAPAARSRASP